MKEDDEGIPFHTLVTMEIHRGDRILQRKSRWLFCSVPRLLFCSWQHCRTSRRCMRGMWRSTEGGAGPWRAGGRRARRRGGSGAAALLGRGRGQCWASLGRSASGEREGAALASLGRSTSGDREGTALGVGQKDAVLVQGKTAATVSGGGRRRQQKEDDAGCARRPGLVAAVLLGQMCHEGQRQQRRAGADAGEKIRAGYCGTGGAERV
jgi:hypothetical protein